MNPSHLPQKKTHESSETKRERYIVKLLRLHESVVKPRIFQVLYPFPNPKHI